MEGGDNGRWRQETQRTLKTIHVVLPLPSQTRFLLLLFFFYLSFREHSCFAFNLLSLKYDALSSAQVKWLQHFSCPIKTRVKLFSL